MGSCAGKNHLQEILPNLPKLTYPRKIQIKIVIKDQNNKVSNYDVVNSIFKNPLESKSQSITINSQTIQVSSCVIPGMDPRGQYPKECQDGCFTNVYKLQNGEELLIAFLFDGHGKEGSNVVAFCKKFMKDFFEKNLEKIQNNYADIILQAFENCDSFLREKSGFDVSNSGSTCVMALVSKELIATASIGDSRCVLGFLSSKENIKQDKSQGKQTRQVIPVRPIEAVQLTVDQKPEHQEEYKRIIQHGGQVRRIKDEVGNEVGPYRV